jgi:hypothetical protein
LALPGELGGLGWWEGGEREGAGSLARAHLPLSALSLSQFFSLTPHQNPPHTPTHTNTAAILGIGGAAAFASSADSKFAAFIDKATLRDCNDYAGYEPALKGEGGLPAGGGGGAGRKAAPKKKK